MVKNIHAKEFGMFQNEKKKNIGDELLFMMLKGKTFVGHKDQITLLTKQGFFITIIKSVSSKIQEPIGQKNCYSRAGSRYLHKINDGFQVKIIG